MSNQSHKWRKKEQGLQHPMLYSYENMEPDVSSGSGLFKNIPLPKFTAQ